MSVASGTEVHILILTPEKLAELREADTPFYAGLMRWGITIGGASIGND